MNEKIVNKKEDKAVRGKGTDIATYALIAAFAVYGLSVALPAVTGPVLGSYFDSRVNDPAAFAVLYVIVIQWVGIIVGNFTLARLKKYVNLRWILMASFGLLMVMYILISLTTTFFPTRSPEAAMAQGLYTAPFVYYSFMIFILGLSLGPINATIIGYISEVYTGRKKNTYLSVTNGIYGIGASILPLAGFGLVRIINSDPGTQSNAFLGFYIAGAAFAFLALILSTLVNYKHDYGEKELEARTIAEKNISNQDFTKVASSIEESASVPMANLKELSAANISAAKKEYVHKDIKGILPLVLLVIAMTAYIIIENVFQYNYNNFITTGFSAIGYDGFLSNLFSDPSGADTLIALAWGQTIIGIYYFTLGITRIVTPFTFARWMGPKWFVVASGSIVLFGYILTLIVPVMTSLAGPIVVAIIFGIGLGNIFPMFMAFCTSINRKKTQLYVEVIVTSTYFAIIAATIVNAGFAQILGELVNAQGQIGVLDGPWIIGVIAAVLFIGLFIIATVYVRKKRKALGMTVTSEKEVALLSAN